MLPACIQISCAVNYLFHKNYTSWPVSTSLADVGGSERISLWWYVGYACLGITAGLAFYVLHKEPMPQVARRHLIMSIWLPLVVWVPVYIAIVGAAIAADQSMVGRAPF